HGSPQAQPYPRWVVSQWSRGKEDTERIARQDGGEPPLFIGLDERPRDFARSGAKYVPHGWFVNMSGMCNVSLRQGEDLTRPFERANQLHQVSVISGASRAGNRKRL